MSDGLQSLMPKLYSKTALKLPVDDVPLSLTSQVHFPALLPRERLNAQSMANCKVSKWLLFLALIAKLNTQGMDDSCPYLVLGTRGFCSPEMAQGSGWRKALDGTRPWMAQGPGWRKALDGARLWLPQALFAMT